MDNRLRSTILPTFNGDGKRYPFWKKRIENYFRLDDLLYVFERTPLEEEYASPVINASSQVENQRKAKMIKRLKDKVFGVHCSKFLEHRFLEPLNGFGLKCITLLTTTEQLA